MPTLAPGNCIQIGQWSLSGAATVGVDGSGQVSIGVNKKGDIVAMKRMNVSESNKNKYNCPLKYTIPLFL